MDPRPDLHAPGRVFLWRKVLLRHKILVIDDDAAIRRTLRMTLEEENYEMLEAASGAEGIQKALSEDPDLVLLDVKMPIMDGMEVLVDLLRQRPEVPVIMISGHADVPTTVEALQKGARDVLEKPFADEVLLRRLENHLELRQRTEEADEHKDREEERYRIVSDSPRMKEMLEAIGNAAPTNATVLITGESGTGKELVARAVHRQSQRTDKPFIKVNCAAIPEDLIESELFGHERGSFTGATVKQVGKFVQADGGTIFLDEVGDMSARTQAKVLRVLQEGEVEPVGAAQVFRVDVRVLAATNKDLPTEIREGRFREDLLFRLNVVPIECPPLRERPDDIPVLVEHFIQRFCQENNFRRKTFSDEAMDKLRGRSWPGNVRELRNIVERMLIMNRGDTVRDLPPAEDLTPAGRAGLRYDRFRTLKEFKEVAERAFLEHRLQKNDWNISQTAKEIDTPRSNLYKKLEQYGLEKGKAGGEEAAEEF